MRVVVVAVDIGCIISDLRSWTLVLRLPYYGPIVIQL